MSEVIDEILKARYLRDGERNWFDICKRVAHYIANSNEEEIKFMDLLTRKVFLPNSPCLMNAGTDNPQMSACFVLPIEDSIDGIFTTIKNAAIIHKSGGGTGFNFSNIRPEGSVVHSTDGIASGPVSFMKVFNSATEAIKQGGRRRGANMAILNWNHPDIHQFINCKQVEGDLSNFNISVMLDDYFMDNYKNDENLKKIMDEIIVGIHNNGEPGILFKDTINDGNVYGVIDATNPCGEQPLLPYEACNLGSIDLSKLVLKDGHFDLQGLKYAVETAVTFLDNVIDKSVFPLPEITKAVNESRKIGLGIMGTHDMLIKMGIPYDSQEARDQVSCIMRAIREFADRQSEIIMLEKGCCNAVSNKRNVCTTCIAPTGTISLIAGCSSGIEPNFSYVYTRKNTVGKEFKIVHPLFMEALNNLKIPIEEKDEIVEEMYCYGSIQDDPYLPQEFKNLFKTALDISPTDHILMQAACQEFVDAGISKTINMSNDATLEDIEDAINLAWERCCKGITIYRNGSRKDVVLALNEEPEEESGRPVVLEGKTYRANSGCCKLYITVNEKSDKPYEVLVHTNGTGCSANTEALSRIISISLQNGVSPGLIVNQFSKVKCISCAKNPNAEGKSCSDIIGKCITESDKEVKAVRDDRPKCPDCGSPLEFGEGCSKGTCKVCGWSGCL